MIYISCNLEFQIRKIPRPITSVKMFLSKLIPILVLGRIAVLAQGVTCPYVYPVEITTSNSINGLVFNVEAPGLPYNLRSLQLRPNASQPGTFIAAIDNTSAVFSGNLIDGGLCKFSCLLPPAYCFQPQLVREILIR